MLSAKMDLLMKRLDERAEEKKEVMHIHDSRMTCEECGETGHSGNNCPQIQEDVVTEPTNLHQIKHRSPCFHVDVHVLKLV